ncbi:MAG TPA: hypothetical protein VEB66_14850 [Opitutaceae bacterium]|nr:hypothetical protein [Opitutaceae bacterium]
MKTLLRQALSLAALPSLALAVYAPIPEQDQGKALTVRLGASVSHDSNIFGSPTNEIDSMVYSFTPSIAFNGSVTDQTFVSAGYDLRLDNFSDRPGDKTVDSHTFSGRVAHQFAPTTTVDVSDTYQIARNPESLLAGVPINTDQSFKSNQFNIRYSAALGQKTTTVVKYRNLMFDYDNPNLGASLDRVENLAGAEVSFAYLPETKLVGEYRYLDVAYDVGGAGKDKQSHYFMAGADYSPNQQVTVTGRLGLENRSREAESDTTAPYAELSLRYAYTEGSYVAAGYSYALEESSDTNRFTDTQVSRLFLNFEHKLTALVIATGSFTYEPAQLQGRRGIAADIDEDSSRVGLGLNWLPNKNWLVGASVDFDRVSSDDINREQDRTRVGVNARYSF